MYIVCRILLVLRIAAAYHTYRIKIHLYQILCFVFICGLLHLVNRIKQKICKLLKLLFFLVIYRIIPAADAHIVKGAKQRKIHRPDKVPRVLVLESLCVLDDKLYLYLIVHSCVYIRKQLVCVHYTNVRKRVSPCPVLRRLRNNRVNIVSAVRVVKIDPALFFKCRQRTVEVAGIA